MPLWKLIPMDLHDSLWSRSVYRGEAVVRAPTEKVARSVATLTFGQVRKPERGQRSSDAPWRNATQVHAERIVDAQWGDEGPVMVLEPAGYGVDYSNIRFADE
jgi:hypothetical protein